MKKKAGLLYGRRKFLCATYMFILASVTLFLEFYVLYRGEAQENYYHKKAAPWATNKLASILGAISCIAWFLGFALLVDWLAMDMVPSRKALIGAIIKLIASVLFNIQPFSQILDKNSTVLVQGLGVPWSNFVAICFFHAGNCWDFCHMLYATKKLHLFSIPNLPLFGMTCFMVATWCISIGNGIEYFSLQGTEFAPPVHPHISQHQLKHDLPQLQLAGSLLLLLGSFLYLAFGFLCTAWQEVEPDDDDDDVNSSSYNTTTEEEGDHQYSAMHNDEEDRRTGTTINSSLI